MEAIDLTKDPPNDRGIEETLRGIPIALSGVAHKTLGVVNQDGEVLAYPAGGSHEEAVTPVWIDPTGQRKDELGLTQPQRETLKFAESLPVLSSPPQEKVLLFAQLNGVGLSSLILSTHFLLCPRTDPNPTAFETVIYKDGSTIVDEPVKPNDRFAFIDVASKMINSVSERSQDAGLTQESVDAALVRISNLIALATVISHPSEDGNGRTSRALCMLTRFGIPIENQDLSLFAELTQDHPDIKSRPQGEIIRPIIKNDQHRHNSWVDALNFAASPSTPLTEEGQEQYEKGHSAHFTTIFDNRIT